MKTDIGMAPEPTSKRLSAAIGCKGRGAALSAKTVLDVLQYASEPFSPPALPTNSSLDLAAKSVLKWVPAIALLIVSGCSPGAKIDYDLEHSFAAYRSYAWDDGDVHPADALIEYPLAKKRIIKAVNEVLQKKGFLASDGSDPDFTVFVHGAVKEHLQISDTGDTYTRYRFGAMQRPLDVSSYEEGTLFIDMVDRTTNELVWRGSLTKVIGYHRDPNKAQAAIEKVVRNILQDFPPTPGG